MKLAIILIILGGVLLVDGGSRITVGLFSGNTTLMLGGLLTGVFLGGLLLYKGIRRCTKIRKKVKVVE